MHGRKHQPKRTSHRGNVMVEYGLLGSLVLLAAVGSMVFMGNGLKQTLLSMSTEITRVSGVPMPLPGFMLPQAADNGTVVSPHLDIENLGGLPHDITATDIADTPIASGGGGGGGGGGESCDREKLKDLCDKIH